jgi:restriction system protein
MRKKRKNTTAKGTQYEEHVAAKMRWHGYRFVKRVGKSGDMGADIIARTGLFGRKVVVQCKNYSGKVGNAAVQEINAARMYYHASIAVVATNSTFTESARQLARACGVQLWERY